jgi:putative hemolysin
VETISEVLTIVVLILFNGFFAGAEIAILTARRNRLEQAAAAGSKGAKAALSLLADTSNFLSTVQIGITGVGTLAAAYGGVSLVSQLAAQLAAAPWPFVAEHSRTIALAIVTGCIAFGSLVLGELVPKRFALAYAERLAQFVAVPMVALRAFAKPFILVLGGVTRVFLKVLHVDDAKSSLVTVEDIAHVLQTGKEQGVLEETEHEVAFEALQLRNRRVRDIMRPRIDIDAVDIETPAQEVVGAVAMSGFSRLPVYEGDLDHIVGFVYNKDLFQQHFLGRDIQLRSVLRQPLFIPENLALDKLLVTFQERRTQLAIVLDEFGGTRGMVTFEDVLEELVGEIHDEHRRDEEHLFVKRDDSSWLVDGLLPLHDLVDHLPAHATLAQDAQESSTMSGLVTSLLQDVPKVGDVVTSGQVRIEVVDMDGKRIDRLLVSVPAQESDSAG